MTVTAQICPTDGCDRPIRTKGLCDTHYARVRLTGKLDPERPIRLRVRAPVIDGTRQCTKCLEVRPVEHYCRDASRPTGRHPWCRKCRSDDRKARYVRDPQTFLAKQQWKTTKYRHGLTKEGYESLLQAQGGVCAICGVAPGERRFAIDHDHKCCPGEKPTCGKCIRGLLCLTCNTMLGHANDEPRRLEKAASYLREWSQSL